MPITILRALAPNTREPGDELFTIVPRPDNVPLALIDGHGDCACGRCGLVLLRGERVARLGEDRVVEPGARGLLVRCPGCGWDNAVPRG